MTQVSAARIAVARAAALILIGLAAYWIFVFTQTDKQCPCLGSHSRV